jgi:ABC-type multidrug transport system fused ATPase/permease subunit
LAPSRSRSQNFLFAVILVERRSPRAMNLKQHPVSFETVLRQFCRVSSALRVSLTVYRTLLAFIRPTGRKSLLSSNTFRRAAGSNQVYSNLDLTIERGERTVLVGPNGAGRSPRRLFISAALPRAGGQFFVQEQRHQFSQMQGRICAFVDAV